MLTYSSVQISDIFVFIIVSIVSIVVFLNKYCEGD
jgi:hypothetical protein